MKCINCGYESSPGYKFCGMCGTRLGKECTSCGQSNPWEYLFCGNCGHRLDELGIETGLAATGQAKTSAAREIGVAPGAALLEGERRVVTVLVADVTGSTNLLEELGNETWVEMMNRVLLALEAEIYRFGGVVDQFRGDGLVAFFGSDVSNEDDAERAILAGLAMLQAIHRFNDDRVTKLSSGIRLRVGVNSGEVIVASIGDKRQHREDTAMGIAIAVAARLESAALPGTVLASESAYQQALDKFTWEALGEISVKGLSQPLAVFRPTTVRPETDLAFNIEVFGNQIPLVGRDNELHRLNQHVELLKMGQGSLVLLNGETGIGKQALIAETRQYFLRQEALIADAESREVRPNEQIQWLIGRCRSYNRNWPYSLWVELLLNWLNSYTGQRPEEIADRLLAECKNLWGDQYNRYFPHLAELLHLSLSSQYEGKADHFPTDTLRQQFLENMESTPSDTSRQQIADAVLGWLEALAGRSPLAVVLSEVEWADPSSLHMIKTSAGLVERCPVFFILLYRDEPDSVMGDTLAHIREKLGDLSEEVALNPLGDDDCNQLIDQLIGPDVLPVETRDLLVKNSEGNPSYIVEILRSWIDREVLVQNSESRNWCLSRPVNSADLQGNLNRLLQARIDRLGEEERQTLQMAAVIGTVFWSNILQSVMGDQILVKEPLNGLVKAQLIDRQSRNPELGWEYSFRTDLIHAVVYDSLLTTQREMFHLHVANSLEEISPENSGIQHQALIAFHYRRAREPRKELFYAIWAAEKAREVYAIEEAIEHYSRALELLDELGGKTREEKQKRALYGQRFEVLNGRQSARFQLGDIDGGISDAKALLELAKEMPDEPIWMIDALLKQPEITLLETRDNLRDGLVMADQALDFSRQLGDRHREMFSLIAKARLMNIAGDLEAFTLAKQALDLARELGDVETQVILLLGISSGYGMEDIQHCDEYLQAAMPLSEQLQNKRIQLELLSALGDRAERNGDYYQLLTEYHGKRLNICREIGDRIMEGMVLMSYAQVEGLYLGDYEAALGHAETAFQLTEKVAGSLYPLLRLAQIQTYMELFSDAAETLSRAAPLSEIGAYYIGMAGRWLVSAIMRIERGSREDLEDALEEIAQVHQLVIEQKISAQYRMAANCLAARAHYGLAKLAEDPDAQAQHARQALEESTRAREIFDHYGFVQIIESSSEEILFTHARSLEINGQAEDAARFFNRAYDEMMRKYDFIPAGSHFRPTFLENIALHRDIRAVHQPSSE